MNLKQLEYFLTLAKIEHYGQTAEQVYITEPSLHRAVRELEKELGVPLFEKWGRNIFMTKYGRIFLPYIAGLVASGYGISIVPDFVEYSYSRILLM